MSNLKPLFSSGKDNWRTPLELFRKLDEEFHFDIDLAANEDSKLCQFYYGPGSQVEDALAVEWHWTAGFCNPPYTKVKEFVAKADWERRHGTTTVMLIPSRTDTRYWHTHIWDAVKHQPYPGVELRFIKGRVKFVDPNSALLRGTKMNGSNNCAPFPSVIVIFRGMPA